MKTNLTTDPMKRGEFLRSLGLSSAALMSFYCMGTLTSCSSSNDPAPSGSTNGSTTPVTSTGLTGNADTSKGKIDFTLDLANADFTTLKSEGKFVKVGSILVANTKGNKFVAIQRLCTHEGFDTVSYQLDANNFNCSTHGSVFNTDGSVVTGPAAKAMKLYKATLSADSSKLQITE